MAETKRSKEATIAYDNARAAYAGSMSQLARKTGINLTKLSRWKRGKASLNNRELELVQDARIAATKFKCNLSRGQALKTIRKLHGISQQELAKHANIKQSQVSIVESDYLARILGKLETALSDLVEIKQHRKAYLERHD